MFHGVLKCSLQPFLIDTSCHVVSTVYIKLNVCKINLIVKKWQSRLKWQRVKGIRLFNFDRPPFCNELRSIRTPSLQHSSCQVLKTSYTQQSFYIRLRRDSHSPHLGQEVKTVNKPKTRFFRHINISKGKFFYVKIYFNVEGMGCFFSSVSYVQQ